MSFSALPRDVCVRVLIHLALDERAACAVQCVALREATRDAQLWRVLKFADVKHLVSCKALRSLCKQAGANLQELDLRGLNSLSSGVRGRRQRIDEDSVVHMLQHQQLGACNLVLQRLTVDEISSAHKLLAAARVCPQLNYCAGTFYPWSFAETAALLSQLGAGAKKLIVQPRDWHSNVPTDPLDFKAMYEALSADTSVTRFHIEEVKLTDQAAVALAAALTSNSTLRKLDLIGNDVSDAAMVSLCSGLAPPSACHLTRIRLNGGHIRNAGAVAFAAVLRTNTSMIEVDISNNYIGSVGAAALASAVSSNRTLIKLNLWLNEINDDGGIAFANALALNDCALEELNLGAQMRVDGFAGWGLLGNQFAEAMGAALHTNTALKATNLYIAQALKDCAISILDLTSTYGRDEGAAYFAEALLHRNGTLTSLSLGECGITADGAAKLADGLFTNTSLKLLDLRMNPLQNSGLEALSTVLTDRDSTLEVLVLSDEPEDTHGEGITRDLRYLNRALASRAQPLELRIRNRVTFVNENGLLTGDPYPSTATDYGELVLEGMHWWARCNEAV